MREALKEAKKAYGKEEVPVGAVIVHEGNIIARAHNLREKKQSAIAHAEILCIEKACKKLKTWRLDNMEMYVTLEPCAMCTGGILQSRLSKIYIGARDPKNGCVGSVCNLLEENTTHHADYEYVDEEACSQILSDFFKMLRERKKNDKET